MTELEKLALHVAMLAAAVGQLMEQVEKLHREMLDLRDIFRNCACFGVDDGTEVP